MENVTCFVKITLEKKTQISFVFVSWLCELVREIAPFKIVHTWDFPTNCHICRESAPNPLGMYVMELLWALFTVVICNSVIMIS